MKYHISIVFAAALSLAACHGSAESHGHNEHEHEHNHSHGEAEEHHDGEIELHDHIAERMGVKTDTLRPGVFHSVVKASGRVTRASGDRGVVSAPTAGIVHFLGNIDLGSSVAKGGVIATIDARGISGGDRNAAAKVALDNARRELERVKSLFDNKLATQGELLAAQAAVNQAEADYSPAASTGRATAPLAGTITELLVEEGRYVAAGEPIAAVSKGGGSVLRVDLPRRYYARAQTFVDLSVELPGADVFKVSERGGKRLTTAPSGDNDETGAYIPVYFSMPSSNIPAGTAFTAYLIGPSRADVLTVPVTALSEQQGQYFVYEMHEAEHYVKRLVQTGETDGSYIEILGGVDPGDVIVTHGVAAVRMAEVSAVAPEGHTHNH